MPDSNTVSVVAALAVRDGGVFLARRAPSRRHGGLWELPGGKVEPGEKAALALVRELREELEIEARVEEVAYDESVQYVEGTRFRFLVFRTLFASPPVFSTDHDRWGYFPPARIPFDSLAPLDSTVLRRWSREA